MLNLKDPELLRQQCYIDGAWVDADNGATLDVTNPATGELVARVPKMGAAETRRAIEAAERAWPAWKRKTAKERSAILRRWFELMMAAQDDLAAILTAEQGKPLAEAKGEIAYGASYFEWYAEEAKRVYGDTIPTHQGDKRVVVLKDPIGVCAAVTPWNFPNAMITRKAGPALAAGCTMVLKPASQTPYSALALVELAHRAGIPAGVLSVVTGSFAVLGALDQVAIGITLTFATIAATTLTAGTATWALAIVAVLLVVLQLLFVRQRFFFTHGHDKSIWAVANHLADAAGVDSQIYELIEQTNPQLARQVRVLEKMPEAPTGPIVVRSSLDSEEKASLRRIFYTMHENPDLDRKSVV